MSARQGRDARWRGRRVPGVELLVNVAQGFDATDHDPLARRAHREEELEHLEQDRQEMPSVGGFQSQLGLVLRTDLPHGQVEVQSVQATFAGCHVSHVHDLGAHGTRCKRDTVAPPAQSTEQEPADVTAEVLRDAQINHVHQIGSEPLDAQTWDRPHFAAKLSRGAQLRPESRHVDRTRVVVRTSIEPGVAQPAT